MMTGEFEYGDLFFGAQPEENAINDPFPAYSAPLFMIFVLLMPIIIMNLLLGLAVGDIQQIQENAELQTLSMKVHSSR